MTIWDRIADLVTRRPKRVLVLALVPLILPLLALPALRMSHDTLATLPPSAQSVAGFRALSQHLPAGATAPLVLVIDDETSVFDPAAFRALGDLSRNLRRLPHVASVRSAAMPTDGRRPSDLDEGFVAEAEGLTVGLREAAGGAGELARGIEEVGAALAEIERRLPAPGAAGQPDLGDAVAGTGALVAGLEEARAGVGRLRAGAQALRAGAGDLGAGLADARAGAARLRTDVAAPTDAALRRAVDALGGFTLGTLDPRYRDAAEAVGEAFGRVTGRFPPGHRRAGAPVQEGYDGLVAALDDLVGGLDAARTGSGELAAGLAQLDAGLAALDAGLAEGVAGARALQAGLTGGADSARGHLADLADGLAELSAGVTALRAGVDDALAPGARVLQAELLAGAEQVEASGLAGLTLGAEEGPFVLTAAMLDADPALREDLGFFVAHEDRRTRVFVGLDIAPFSDEAIAAVSEIRDVARTSLLASPLDDAFVATTGPAAFLDEVDRASTRDFPIIVGMVTLGVFLVLVALLRSLLAPLYMITTVLLSYGAALGTTTVVVQGFLGEPGLQWYIPPLLFVLLIALGVDYSIFLMGRVREEATHRTTRDAVAEAVRHTGRIITSAGVILAGTFAVLLVAPLRSLMQLGLAAAVGILLDTFVVRALLVPALAVLLGRWNWWPSARAAGE